ncbi:30S ribosomal protein S6 [Candidatus Peregrinibacteria bacterium]|nr:30S ribosomal protein S6 [Candidatus Peregrinibacteria bacterium]
MAKKKDAASVVLQEQNKKYELVLILQPEMLESAVEKKLREFEKYLEENGGTVDMKDIWGMRKLAYRIGPHDSGIYIVYNLTLPTSFNIELDEHMRIDKDIIRFLHISLKDDYEYTKFKEEKVIEEKPKQEEVKEEVKTVKKPTRKTHKAEAKEAKPTEIKDKGKKADAESLDEKLDKLLEGDDLNI